MYQGTGSDVLRMLGLSFLPNFYAMRSGQYQGNMQSRNPLQTRRHDLHNSGRENLVHSHICKGFVRQVFRRNFRRFDTEKTNSDQMEWRSHIHLLKSLVDKSSNSQKNMRNKTRHFDMDADRNGQLSVTCYMSVPCSRSGIDRKR